MNRLATYLSIVIVVGETTAIAFYPKYGLPFAWCMWVTWSIFSLVFLRKQLNKFNETDFKQEIRSINCQNWTFILTALIAGADFMLVLHIQKEEAWGF